MLNTPLVHLELFSTLDAIVVAFDEIEQFLFLVQKTFLQRRSIHFLFNIGQKQNIRNFGRNLKVEKIVITGGGNVGLEVARHLKNSKPYHVKIIEKERARAEVPDKLEKTIVNGDGWTWIY